MSWSHIDVDLYEAGNLSASELLTRLEERYRETENPLCCWFALRTCLQEGRPLPPFVSHHMLAIATDLCRLAELDDAETFKEPQKYVRPVRETLRGVRASRMEDVVVGILRLAPEGVGRKADAFEAWCPPRAEQIRKLYRMARAEGNPPHIARQLVAHAWKVKEETVISIVESAGKKRKKLR